MERKISNEGVETVYMAGINYSIWFFAILFGGINSIFMFKHCIALAIIGLTLSILGIGAMAVIALALNWFKKNCQVTIAELMTELNDFNAQNMNDFEEEE